MKAPGFWFARTPSARTAAALLAPFELVTATLTARRLRKPGWRAPVPVICCGNAGVGGAGKTTLALDLAARLVRRGVRVHCLTRGYGGQARRAPLRVDPARHDATIVGDEALLLASVAPCWVGADRAASAKAAIAEGAEMLLMDDGLQNPGLIQTLPILVVDGATGFGNARLLPAGPLREPVACAAGRAACAVVIGPCLAAIAPPLPPGLPILGASLALDPSVHALEGDRLIAFAGIARPEKFFHSLRGAGLTLRQTHGFADHRPFRALALARLRREAAEAGARLITTRKDWVRLPPDERHDVLVADVGLLWDDPAAPDRLLDRAGSP